MELRNRQSLKRPTWADENEAAAITVVARPLKKVKTTTIAIAPRTATGKAVANASKKGASTARAAAVFVSNRRNARAKEIAVKVKSPENKKASSSSIYDQVNM